MLKALISYSKKIPVEGAQYSSQGYSLSLETEIPETDATAIQARLHETFELVKSQVEQELANGNGNDNQQAPTDTGANKTPFRKTNTSDNGKNSNGKATNRQIKFITDLANQQNMAISDLNGKIRDRFGLDGLYDLNKKQASSVLDLLKAA